MRNHGLGGLFEDFFVLLLCLLLRRGGKVEEDGQGLEEERQIGAGAGEWLLQMRERPRAAE